LNHIAGSVLIARERTGESGETGNQNLKLGVKGAHVNLLKNMGRRGEPSLGEWSGTLALPLRFSEIKIGARGRKSATWKGDFARKENVSVCAAGM
jgi:hypothetical protein